MNNLNKIINNSIINNNITNTSYQDEIKIIYQKMFKYIKGHFNIPPIFALSFSIFSVVPMSHNIY